MPEIAMDTAYEAILLSQCYNYSENYDFRNSWINRRSSPLQGCRFALVFKIRESRCIFFPQNNVHESRPAKADSPSAFHFQPEQPGLPQMP